MNEFTLRASWRWFQMCRAQAEVIDSYAFWSFKNMNNLDYGPTKPPSLPFLPPRRALNLGILRDPGSEVEDRQYQLDLQSINFGTTQWEQLKPEKEGVKGGVSAESERSSQNPALEWNMAST